MFLNPNDMESQSCESFYKYLQVLQMAEDVQEKTTRRKYTTLSTFIWLVKNIILRFHNKRFWSRFTAFVVVIIFS